MTIIIAALALGFVLIHAFMFSALIVSAGTNRVCEPDDAAGEPSAPPAHLRAARTL